MKKGISTHELLIKIYEGLSSQIGRLERKLSFLPDDIESRISVLSDSDIIDSLNTIESRLDALFLLNVKKNKNKKEGKKK